MSKSNGKLKEHELSMFFPMLNIDEYDALKKSIAKLGQLEPVTLYNGEVLDGRNRLKACQELGIEPIFQDLPEGLEPLDYVVARNLLRRNISEGQIAAVGARLTSDSTYGHGGQGSSSDHVHLVAEQIGVSSKSVGIARDLHQNHPDIFKRLESGEISLRKADGLRRVASVPHLTKTQRKQALEKAEEFRVKDIPALAMEVEDGVIKQGTSGFKQVMRMTPGAIVEHTETVKPVLPKTKPTPEVKVDYIGAGQDAIADLKRAWSMLEATKTKSKGDKQMIVQGWWNQVHGVIVEWDEFTGGLDE